ncbi:hypothetical protein [Halobaculum sp. D14]|uniref:hypothetical protein n=1 Tax=unclassified Halobaculum TaxID=2640896 RepID=UPI003EBF2108
MVDLSAVVLRVGDAVAAAWVRASTATRRLLFHSGYRPALLYLLALNLGGVSFLLFLVGSGGGPSRFQFALLLASLAVVLYLSIRQAGNAPTRGR